MDWITVNEVNEDTWNREGTIEGVYTAKKTNVGPNDSTMYSLKNGEKVVNVWGSAVLDSRFDQIKLGSEVRITSLGKVKSEKSNREYYDYKVEYRPTPFVEATGSNEPPVSSRTEEINVEDIPF